MPDTTMTPVSVSTEWENETNRPPEDVQTTGSPSQTVSQNENVPKVEPLDFTGEKIGYARVSTTSQSLQRQIDALEAAGCEHIFTDKTSGRTMDRPGWNDCRSYLRRGDKLLITELDRLGRSTYEIVHVADNLTKDGIVLESTGGMTFSTDTAMGAAMLTMVAAIAQLEIDLKAERQAAAREARKAQGLTYGRQPAIAPKDYQAMVAMLRSGMTVVEVAKHYECGRASVYRALERARMERGDAFVEGAVDPNRGPKTTRKKAAA